MAASNKIATIFIILVIGFAAGPAVSYKGHQLYRQSPCEPEPIPPHDYHLQYITSSIPSTYQRLHRNLQHISPVAECTVA